MKVLSGSSWSKLDTTDGMANNYVYSIIADAVNDEFWFSFGWNGNGISRYGQSGWTNYNTADGLADHRVACLFLDSQDNIWAGTYGNGISKFNGNSWISYNTSNGLPGSEVRCITEDFSGNIWVGTNSGVAKFNGSSWTAYTSANGLGGNNIWAAGIDLQGNVWFAPYDAGVSCFDGSQWVTYTTADGLASNTVRAIKHDNAGNLWFGTSGGGVSKFYNPVSVTPVGSILATSLDTVFSAEESFWVDIEVQNVSDLFGTSFFLNFNQISYISTVSVDSIVAGDFLGNDLVFLSNVESDRISIAVSQKAGGTGVTGSGTVARAKFTSLASTPIGTDVTFDVSDVISIDPLGSDITLLDNVDLVVSIEGVFVWPGDADNSGYVDQADILSLGIYWNQGSIPRPNASRLWEAQSTTPWNPEISTYSDCDGNGYIDQADVLPIGLNWHKSHGTLLAGASEQNPKIDFEDVFYFESTQENNTQYLSLYLKKNVLVNLKGLAFSACSLSPEADILQVVRGDDWSPNSIYIVRQTGNEWGLAITETDGLYRKGSSALITFQIGENFNNSFPEMGIVSLSDMKISLESGEILTVNGANGSLSSSSEVFLPKAFVLSQNNPNPFNPSTTISYSVAEGKSGNVSLSVYNIRGKRVATLVDEFKEAGHYSVTWNGDSVSGEKVPSGVYFYRLAAEDYVSTRKMVLLK